MNTVPFKKSNQSNNSKISGSDSSGPFSFTFWVKKSKKGDKNMALVDDGFGHFELERDVLSEYDRRMAKQTADEIDSAVLNSMAVPQDMLKQASKPTTLLELVENCEPVKEKYETEKTDLDMITEYESLGFTFLAEELYKKIELKAKLARLSEHCYIKITDEKIKNFLNKKIGYAGRDDRTFGQESLMLNGFGVSSMSFVGASGWPVDIMSVKPSIQKQEEKTRLDLLRSELVRLTSNTVRGDYFSWKETLTEEYKASPPIEVLKTLSVHKERKVFDYFTIASVEKIHDPLLLGRIIGCPDRFFIAQWGDDIQLDDIL